MKHPRPWTWSYKARYTEIFDANGVIVAGWHDREGCVEPDDELLDYIVAAVNAYTQEQP